MGPDYMRVWMPDNMSLCTRSRIGDFLRSHGSRLLHSSVTNDGASFPIITVGDKWFVPNSVLEVERAGLREETADWFD